MIDPTQALTQVQEKIAQAVAKSGRRPEDVELVAISKTHPPDTVRAAAESGQTLFGESRVQEARAKIPMLPGRLRWHFIGHLQKNKIRAALPLFELFHSVDSLEIAQQIQRIAEEESLRPRVLLEINVAGESSKYGFSPTGVRLAVEELLTLDRLDIVGLMTLAPLAPEPEHSRPYFEELRELRDELQTESGLGLTHLSMGMSGDYEVAVEEGGNAGARGKRHFRNTHWQGVVAI